MRRNKFMTLGVFALVLLLQSLVLAALPGRINFQGRLLDKNKNPKSGLFNITFGIWDTGPGTGGSEIWSETQNNIQVTNGMFSVQLGAGTSLTANVFSSDVRWLQIQVGSEILEPRERLVTAPYSFRSSVAESVVDGAISDTQVNSGANIAWTKIDKTGSSLADLATKNAGALDNGTLLSGRLNGDYLNDVKVSSAIYANSANTAANATNATNAAQVPATGILSGNLGSSVIASSIAVNAIGTEQLIANTIINADIDSSANISWTKIDKTGSSLADLATRSAGDLNSGTLAEGRLPSGTVILLYPDETDSVETTASLVETTLKSWSLPANSYSTIIIEAELRGRVEQDATTRCDFTWRFKEGATTQKTYVWRIIGMATAGADSGGRYTATLKTSFAGGQAAATTLSVTGQMSLSNAATGILAHSFRVYAVK